MKPTHLLATLVGRDFTSQLPLSPKMLAKTETTDQKQEQSSEMIGIKA